ncbi:unnamed protein product [Heligmosomoides polygyrus]|uniref:NR LBD domain-containing protein n=1 Tax=Heligmosomoides polygyrus TaxID=6339 RepID=A0A3P7YW76_HELPZ|nr:unnamed protein product [Heligmosomoides polygyrus]
MPNWPLKTLPPPSEEEFEQIRKGMRPGFPREPERKNWFFFDIMSSVEWAKTFSVLHKLNRKDQVILLKSVILHCFNATQAFFSYEHKSNTIIHPDGTVPTFHTSFFSLLDEKTAELPSKDVIIVAGDLNGHVGATKDGCSCHGGFGNGSGNADDERILDYAESQSLTIVNTIFRKRDPHLISYYSGSTKTQIDFVLVKDRDRSIVTDVTIVPYEMITPQHRPLICTIKIALPGRSRSNDAKIPEHFKSKIYRAVVRPVAMYGTECWSATKEAETRLSVTKTKMLHRTAGVTLMGRIRNDAIRQKFGVAPIADKITSAVLAGQKNLNRTSSTTDNNPFGNNFFKLAIDPFIRHKIDKKEYVLLKALMLCNASEFPLLLQMKILDFCKKEIC